MSDQKKPYNALDAITAIRTKPDWMIGSTENPNHLIREIIDNSLDEVIQKRATKCAVHVQGDTGWVMDNGQGMKRYDMELPDGRYKDSIHAICTELNSGSKFDTKHYDISIGMHGVGMKAINALSKWMLIQTYDSNQEKTFEYAFDHSELKYIKEIPYTGWSTIIGFQVDPKYFDSSTFDDNEIKSRLLLTQAKFDYCDFTVNNNDIPKISFIEYVKLVLNLKSDTKLFKLSYNYPSNDRWKGSLINIYIAYVEDLQTKVIGDVNTRACDGTYITSFQSLLKNIITAKLPKKFENINADYTLLGLRAYIELLVPEPKFDSQTKTRMTLKIKDIIIDPLSDQVKWFLDQDDNIDIIKHNVSLKFSRSTKPKTSRTKRPSKDSKIVDAITIPGEILYIVEGDSAHGTVDMARDPDTEGVLPAKGKILNIEKNIPLEKIETYSEFRKLKDALGPRDNRRYKKIKMLADADVDGYHINVLYGNVLRHYADDFIKNGNVSVIFPPLFGAIKGKDFIPIYDITYKEYYEKQGYDVRRFKGLGEMNANQMKAVIRQGVEYVLEWPERKDAKILSEIMRNTALKHSLLHDTRCGFEHIFALSIEQQKNKKEEN